MSSPPADGKGFNHFCEGLEFSKISGVSVWSVVGHGREVPTSMSTSEHQTGLLVA